MRTVLLHLVILISLGLGACRESSNALDTTNYESSITDTPTNVEVRLTLDRTELDPSQVLRATLTITYPQGVSIEPIEPLVDESELKVSDRVESAITFDGDRHSRSITLVYEPYLPGTTDLSPFGARIDQEDQPRRVVRLAPVEITVQSMLDESDDGTLEAAAGTYAPPAPDHTSTERALIIAAIAMGVLCLLIVLVIRRLGKPAETTTIPAPEVRIRAALSAKSLDDARIVEIHNALAQLARRRAGIAPLLADVERARFGSVRDREDTIRRAASRAIDFREPPRPREEAR